MELRPGAAEPAEWTVTTDTPLLSPPDVRIGSSGWQVGRWEDGSVPRKVRRVLIDVRHPDPSTPALAGALTVPIGRHKTELRITDSGRTFIRPAGFLTVL